MFLNLIQCHFAGGNRASHIPSGDMGTINPKGLHQARSIPRASYQVNGILGHLLNGTTRAGADRRAPARACSRAHERAAAAGLPGPPLPGLPGREGERPASSAEAKVNKAWQKLSFSHRDFAASRLRVNL